MKNRNEVRLYNVLFPFWMLMLFPQIWLIVLPGNFLIDSLVLIIAMRVMKMEQRKVFYKEHILPVFGCGLLADGIGSVYMLVMAFVFELGVMGDEPYITVPALLISAAMIFILNYFWTFRRLDKPLRWRLALTFAIVTAPYTFLVPSSWLY